MIGNWMVYIFLLSVALAGAAYLAEAILLKWRGPTRAAWTAALLGLFLVPGLAALIAGSPESPGAIATNPQAIDGASTKLSATAPADLPNPVTITAPADAPPRPLADLDRPLFLGWLFLSVCVAAFLGISGSSLKRKHREWRMQRVEGTFIWMSRDMGPAVVGFGHGEIVLPEWFVSLPAPDRHLLLRHEQEHLRAGDPRLWLFALVTLVAFPWNPIVWWKVRRLRTAIEVDCDARVLDHSRQTERYGALLLSMAQRTGRNPLAGAAFSPRSTQLEQRVRAMTTMRGKGWRGVGTAAVLGSALLLTASRVPPPEAVWPTISQDAAPVGEVWTDTAEFTATFVTLDADPVLRNPEEVHRMAVEMADGIAAEVVVGMPVLGVAIDPAGAVTHLIVAQSSGSVDLDHAAIEVMSVAQYTPGVFGGTPVPVYLLTAVDFELGAASSAAAQ